MNNNAACSGRIPESGLSCKMNDAVESFLVFHQAVLTGEYQTDFQYFQKYYFGIS